MEHPEAAVAQFGLPLLRADISRLSLTDFVQNAVVSSVSKKIMINMTMTLPTSCNREILGMSLSASGPNPEVRGDAANPRQRGFVRAVLDGAAAQNSACRRPEKIETVPRSALYPGLAMSW